MPNAVRNPRRHRPFAKNTRRYSASVLTRLLGAFFYFLLPFGCSYYAVNLAVDFTNQIILVSIMSEHFTVAGFTGEYRFVFYPVMAEMFRIDKHRITIGAECPRIMGVIANV